MQLESRPPQLLVNPSLTVAALPSMQYSGLVRFRPVAPVVASERILRIQGYSDMRRVRPAIREAAGAMAALAMRTAEPAAAGRLVPIVSLEGEVVELAGGAKLHCRVFEQALSGCTEVVPFVLTAGRPLGERVVELTEAGDLLEAVLLETAGWLCIEDATRQFKAFLREACLAHGQRITSRMGPGYSYKVAGEMCEWPLEEQATLFEVLAQGEALPVSLMRSSAMNPKPSRSGMFGVAPLVPPTSGGRQTRIQSKERFQ